MSGQNPPYIPPKVWQPAQSGGKFASTNRAVAGATHEQALPKGDKPFQLYSLNTPNGVKVNILLEELLEKNLPAQYDGYLINIMEGDQFGSGFVAINPNSKIPALVDCSGEKPISIFESGAILLHLAEKFNAFVPDNSHPAERAECLSWLFWQMGSAPFLGGGFGHFYVYAPEKLEYPINRYAMEAKRQYDVLDQQLAKYEFICGAEYNIADIAIWSWYGQFALGKVYGDANVFLDLDSYKNVQRWAKQIAERPAVQRGVNLELKPIKWENHAPFCEF